jgi:FkbM family methyltransferase
MDRSLIFDIGMHKGEDTAFYLAKGYRVVGIEADPDLAEFCRRRFASDIFRGRLLLIQGAVVAKDCVDQGKVRFYQNPSVSVWGTIDHAWRDRNRRLGSDSLEIDVDCVNLGAILREIGLPYYIKIDIEGADCLCLEYLRDFEERPQYLSIESEKTDFHKLESEVTMLQTLGYKKFCAVQQAWLSSAIFDGCDLSGSPLKYQFEANASGPFGEDLDCPWMEYDQLLIEYKWIFQMYKLFGNDSPCALDPYLAQFRQQLSRRLNMPLPGWYDTHASL